MHSARIPFALLPWLLLLTAFACSQADDEGAAGADTNADSVSAADTTSPAPKSFGIGVTTLITIGANGRLLPTEVWYPIAADATGDKAKYMSNLLTSPLGAIRDAAALPGPFPLLAFSHGNGGMRHQSVFLPEAVAQRGYVVVSPDHIGNTLTTMNVLLNAVMSFWRPQDLKAAINRVLEPKTGDPAWLTGLVDGDKIAVSGHSFGGYTALAVAGMPVTLPPGVKPNCLVPAQVAACAEMDKLGPPPWSFADPRVDVAIPLAHALYAGGVLVKPSDEVPGIPIIIVAASGDTTTKPALEAVPLYNDLPGAAALLTIQGGSHFSFANVCALEPFMDPVTKASLGGICKPNAKQTMAQSHAAVVKHTLAALAIWLRGDDQARAEFDPKKTTGPVYTLLSKGIYDAKAGN